MLRDVDSRVVVGDIKCVGTDANKVLLQTDVVEWVQACVLLPVGSLTASLWGAKAPVYVSLAGKWASKQTV